MIVGEWSEERSILGVSVSLCLSMFFVITKSMTSGIFLLSVGQYVGVPADVQLKFSLRMASSSCLPLGLVRRGPIGATLR